MRYEEGWGTRLVIIKEFLDKARQINIASQPGKGTWGTLSL
ncbi:MAG: hypothetical protein ABI921_11920 [Panacibacter sp.]